MKLYELERQARRLALPASQKAVLLCLISYSDRNGDGTSIFPGVQTIARETSLCVRTVQYCLRELEVAGWIVAINRKGGYGRPSLYHLNLDAFGGLAAQPIERPAPPQRSPQQQLNYARGMLRRLKEDSPARAKWEQIVADLAQLAELGANNQDSQAPQQSRNLPATIGNQALIPMELDEDLEKIEALYLGMIALQAEQPEGSSKWQWWQQHIDQAREAYNHALEDRGIVASDGQQPALDEELQEQIQAWSKRRTSRQSNRDKFEVGSPRWQKWNKMLEEATITLNSLLYQQGGYVT